MISKKASADESLSKLHSLCFGKPGTKTTRKKNLRIFNGFATEAEVEAKVRKSCTRPTRNNIRLFAACLGNTPEGSWLMLVWLLLCRPLLPSFC